MNLAKFPRRRYIVTRSPIEKLSRLSKRLGGPTLYMKRDDLLGPAGGGNKTRKLDFVVADALEKGADTLITCGAVQSNHCRLTLAAAVREGMACHLVLEERVKGSYNPKAAGNNLLFHLMGVASITVVPGGSDMMAAMQDVADRVAADGAIPYIIPGGASNEIGALGYVACAEELLQQTFEEGIRIDRVVCASGSTGTHAGLLTGLVGNHSHIPVIGINVSRTKDVQEALVYELVAKVAAKVGIEHPIPKEAVECFGDYVGPGYSQPTAGMIEAVQMLAETEAILMDPVYTGKAVAGLIDLVRKDFFKPEENILFVHTGGSPALHVYADCFLGDE